MDELNPEQTGTGGGLRYVAENASARMVNQERSYSCQAKITRCFQIEPSKGFIMPITISDVQAELEAQGLRVVRNNEHSLWIAATVRDAGEGVGLSDDACSLFADAGRWVAVFPADGLATYEVSGPLPELVSLIASVYAHYRQAGGRFIDVFPHVLNGAEQYLAGRSAARV